jgi:hypothetical protein
MNNFARIAWRTGAAQACLVGLLLGAFVVGFTHAVRYLGAHVECGWVP